VIHWFEDMVFDLWSTGCPLERIGDLTLSQLLVMRAAARRKGAQNRQDFITDMSLVVGAIFGGGKEITEHLDSLHKAALGEFKNGDSE